ncbi:MAG TPA: pilus assembly protein TadG-related protein [Rhodocyclaceae bacterium]
MATARTRPARQRGSVTIMVALTAAIVIGFVGLAVDLGRLFVTKTELQSAVDACALAAAEELRPGVAPSDPLAVARAVNAGLTAGNRNAVGFQAAPAGLVDGDILFSDRLSDNSTAFPFGYVSGSAANPATARYAMCAHSQGGIAMWFMQVIEQFLGISPAPASVGAWAVATLAPSQTNCAVPLGICEQGSAPSFGLTPGQWVGGKFSSGGGLTGSFNWIDFSPPSGGASELSALLAGQGQCSLSTSTQVGQNGADQSVAVAWNSRFGIYKSGAGNPSLNSSPPDFTGYSYTPTNWPSQSTAFADFQSRRTAFSSYGDITDTVNAGNTITGLGLSNAYNVATHGSGGQLSTYGADRRIVTAPIVNCASWASSQTVPIDGWACVMLLHPVDAPTSTVHMEFLGLSTTPGSPCATSGLAGGTAGPMVPVLVQ